VANPKTQTGIAEDLHELISFEDPEEDRTWVFDATFLESNYSCIYGRGCKGVHEEDTTELMHGCCSHGAHLIDKGDRKNLEKHVARLRDDQWQYASIGRKKGFTKKNEEGALLTRRVDDACIFLNRPGHPNGAGCALHQAAVEAGERPLDWKPEVCWQLPLRRLDETDPYGHVTSTIREWKRRDWGVGGAEFHWWCTDTSDAYIDSQAVWQTMGDELAAMIGDDAYTLLVDVLRTRAKARAGSGTPKRPSSKATPATKPVAITRKPRRASFDPGP
jgi:hypothetical protein